MALESPFDFSVYSARNLRGPYKSFADRFQMAAVQEILSRDRKLYVLDGIPAEPQVERHIVVDIDGLLNIEGRTASAVAQP